LDHIIRLPRLRFCACRSSYPAPIGPGGWRVTQDPQGILLRPDEPGADDNYWQMPPCETHAMSDRNA